jgi:hypothetical protein
VRNRAAPLHAERCAAATNALQPVDCALRLLLLPLSAKCARRHVPVACCDNTLCSITTH